METHEAKEVPEVGTLPLPPDPDPEKERAFPGEPNDPTESEKLNRLIEQWEDGGGYVEVYRYDKKGGRQFLTRYGIDTFDLQTLQTDFGGGRYQCRLFTPGKKYLGAQTVEIWGEPREVSKTPEGKSLAELFEESQKEIKAMVEAVKNPPPQAEGRHPFELALGLLASFQAMQAPYLEALLTKTKGKEVSSTELLDVFFKGMEAARDMAPEADPYASVIKTFGPQIAAVLSNRATQETTGQSAMRPNPPELGRGPVDTSPRPPWDMMLLRHLPTLQSWAARGKDPGVRALWVLDDIPEEALPLLLEQLGRGEEFMQDFFRLHPETRPQEGWFRDFFSGMYNEFDWEDEGREGGVEVPEVLDPEGVEPPPGPKPDHE